MQLFESIIEANHRSQRGDKMGLDPAQFADALPVAVLSCIDPRLNHLLPDVLGLPEEKVIWLRNAGNIITGPLSSTMRSLALGCVVKGGREIAVIGHTDCLVGKTSMLKLTDRLKELGIERARLPENLIEYFGVFASERQNVMKAVEYIRSSPLIGPKVPVHGLLLDIQNGKLEWLVNGYQALATVSSKFTSTIRKAEAIANSLTDLPQFQIGEMQFPSSKIGEMAGLTKDFLHKAEERAERFEAALDTIKQQVRTVDIPHSTASVSATSTPTPTTPTIAEKVTEAVSEAVNFARKIDPSLRYKIIGSDQKMYGPIPGKTILNWLNESRIDAETPVQLEGTSTWQPLSRLPDLRNLGKLPLPPPLPAGSKYLFKDKRGR